MRETLFLNEEFEIKINHFIANKLNHIFNTPVFFKMHQTERAFYFQLCKKKSDQVLCTIHFTETSAGLFKSPARGTFGGITLEENLDIDIYEQFLKTIENYLYLNGAKTLEIVMPPMCHNESMFSINYNVMVRSGYIVKNPELNYALIVDDNCFYYKINYANKKRLNKCLRENFFAQKLETEFYQEAYFVILENRNRKGFSFSMSYEDILKMYKAFPDSFLFFGVFKQGVLVASSMCVVINSAIIYVFAWGDVDRMQSYSPITLLAAHIYEYAQKNSFKIMDIGTATSQGEPNLGLIQFKRNLGCKESLKLTFCKKFN